MSLQSHDDRIGRRYGSYVVEKLLGEGGMGAVYAAVQPEIGKRVAIKFLAPELAADPQVVQRFFAEAKSVNLIQHENIVDIFDFRTIDGHSYFVMELLAGASLQTTLQRHGKLAVSRVLAIGVQVAAAISAAHAREIVHRDLKPDNIFLTPKAGYEDFVKVLDFGIAKLRRPDGMAVPQTLRGMVMGTPGYMSPEQGTGEAVDARTDIYALGVVLWRALEGRMPFDGRTFEEMVRQQLTQKPKALERKDVPGGLSELLQTMMARDPAKRTQTMREVQERLVPMLRGFGPTPSGRLAPISDGWRSVPPTRMPESRRVPVVKPSRVPQVALVIGLGAATAALAGWLAWRPAAAPASAPPPSPFAAPPPATPPPGNPFAAPPAAPRGPFKIYLESTPPGAEVFAGGRSRGTTPLELTLDADESLRLHKPGFRDEVLPVTSDTEHALVHLRPASAHPHPPGPGAPPATNDGTGLGLND